MDTLFQELDQIIPNNFMSQTFEDSSASLVSAAPPRPSLTSAQQEVCLWFGGKLSTALQAMSPLSHTAQHLQVL